MSIKRHGVGPRLSQAAVHGDTAYLAGIVAADPSAAPCIRDVLGKVPQLDPNEVEDVILGCGQPHGPQGHNIARVAAVRAGLPATVGGLTVNRFCSSGLQAIAIAANYVVNNGADVA